MATAILGSRASSAELQKFKTKYFNEETESLNSSPKIEPDLKRKRSTYEELQYLQEEVQKRQQLLFMDNILRQTLKQAQECKIPFTMLLEHIKELAQEETDLVASPSAFPSSTESSEDDIFDLTK